MRFGSSAGLTGSFGTASSVSLLVEERRIRQDVLSGTYVPVGIDRGHRYAAWRADPGRCRRVPGMSRAGMRASAVSIQQRRYRAEREHQGESGQRPAQRLQVAALLHLVTLIS